MNLIGNAVKFTFSGGILITVQSDLVNKDLFKISVKDTGIGIT